MPSISFQDVSCTYPGGRHEAVRHVGFDVGAGELLVLLGPSGCGKTTLLKTVNQLVKPSGGRVLLEGEDVGMQPATQLRRRIGYVIQATGLFPHLTVGRNIGVVPEILGWQQPAIAERIGTLLDLVSLPRETEHRYPRQLSGGEAQRVGLARALAADPAYLLMDEPFGAIDAINREHLQSVLIEIQQRLHKTILFVTHDIDEAMRLADRIAVMRAGQLVQVDTPFTLLTHPADDFVRDLVGSDDLFRRLGLMPVEAIMGTVEAVDPAGPPVALVRGDDSGRPTLVHAGSTARDALGDLLAADTIELSVVDADGRVVGRVTMDSIRRASR